MVNFQFRVMVEDDLEQVLLTETSSHLTPWKELNFLDCIASNYWNYVLVDCNSPYALLGHCVVMPGFEEVHLLNITIHQDYRRLGIAKKALQAIEQTCVERNFERILLEVRQSNLEAFSLYQAVGFEQIGTRKGYYQLPLTHLQNAREDAIVMQKSLKTEINHP
jgi:[ribosomal protein S18]-alanine N-acetyltransferase